MKTLPLANGSLAIVDDEDFERLSAHRWHCDKAGYVQRTRNVRRKYTTIGLHREVLGASAIGFDVDHINGNKLDNRRANLRAATRSQNMANAGAYCTNRLGVRGVRLNYGKYVARIRVRGELMHLGAFDKIEDAKEAYARAAQKHFGEFARVCNSGSPP